jgi:hypothetical protein
VKGDSLTPEGEAAYWSMRYTIRKGVTEAQECDVPVFLDSSMEAILVTGGCHVCVCVSVGGGHRCVWL